MKDGSASHNGAFLQGTHGINRYLRLAVSSCCLLRSTLNESQIIVYSKKGPTGYQIDILYGKMIYFRTRIRIAPTIDTMKATFCSHYWPIGQSFSQEEGTSGGAKGPTLPAALRGLDAPELETKIGQMVQGGGVGEGWEGTGLEWASHLQSSFIIFYHPLSSF